MSVATAAGPSDNDDLSCSIGTGTNAAAGTTAGGNFGLTWASGGAELDDAPLANAPSLGIHGCCEKVGVAAW